MLFALSIEQFHVTLTSFTHYNTHMSSDSLTDGRIITLLRCFRGKLCLYLRNGWISPRWMLKWLRLPTRFIVFQNCDNHVAKHTTFRPRTPPINVSDLEHLSINVSDLEHLPINVSDLEHLPINLSDLEHLPINLSDLEHLPINPSDLEHLPINVSDLEHLPINVSDVSQLGFFVLECVPDSAKTVWLLIGIFNDPCLITFLISCSGNLV
jgi:hypothetical protein